MQSRGIRTECLKKILPLIAGILGMIGAGAANALTLALDDGNDGFDEVITDNGAGDTNATVGVIVFNQAIGIGNWIVNVTTGLAPPVLEPSNLDLNSVNVSSAGGGTLRIALWETYPDNSDPAFVMDIGGTSNGTLTATASQHAAGTASNILTGTEAPLSSVTPGSGSFGPGPFSASGAFANAASGSPFDLAIDVLITHGVRAGQITSFNAEISPIPLPPAVWLLGSALVLLAGIGRRATRRRNYSAPPRVKGAQ